jgi:hypothetical protein
MVSTAGSAARRYAAKVWAHNQPRSAFNSEGGSARTAGAALVGVMAASYSDVRGRWSMIQITVDTNRL